MYRNLITKFSSKLDENVFSAVKCSRFNNAISAYHSEKVFGYRLKHKNKHEGKAFYI